MRSLIRRNDTKMNRGPQKAAGAHGMLVGVGKYFMNFSTSCA